MRLLILAAAVLLLIQVSAAGAARRELVGGWNPIKDLSDPYVVNIAKYAVQVHNDQAKTGLVLEKLVRGETQVVSGTNYRLVIQAKDKGETKSYEVVVFDKPYNYVRRLISFKPLLGNA